MVRDSYLFIRIRRIRDRASEISKTKQNVKKIGKKNDEIILIGSGKGVASVRTIDQINWKRKNLKSFNKLLKYFKIATNNCPKYR